MYVLPIDSHAVSCFFIFYLALITQKYFSLYHRFLVMLPYGIKKILFVQQSRKGRNMKFIAVGNYTAEGLAGFMKNPKDDRKAVVGGMVAKGREVDELYLTRGSYDVVAIGEAPDFATMAAIKIPLWHLELLRIWSF